MLLGIFLLSIWFTALFLGLYKLISDVSNRVDYLLNNSTVDTTFWGDKD